MKKILRIVLVFVILISVASLALVVTGHQYLFKAVYTTYLMGETGPHINDWKRFDTRTIEAREPQEWKVSEHLNETSLSDKLRSTLEETESVAFLVVKNDAIVFEEYWDGYSAESHTNSFSMAKSITTLLAQVAIQDGYINSWDDDVIKYIPELKGEFAGELRLSHLSTMTAGLEWDEDYKNPFTITAKVNYGKDAEKTILEEVSVKYTPGEEYKYVGGAVELLAMVITRATKRTLSEYAQETLWAHMGAEHDAYWSLDHEDGMELAYCCFNSNARDFARFGKLMINKGNWEGNQLIDSSFIDLATSPGLVPYYGYAMWLYDENGIQANYFRGIGGQYVITIPEKDIVICRLGHKRLPVENKMPGEVPILIEEVVKSFGN